MKCLKNLRRGFERFCYKHRTKGIPNLMLYISVGSGLVYLFTMFTENPLLYDILRFDRDLILQGQVWRLVSYVLTYNGGDILFTLIGLLCYYSLGRAMENLWGTCRFNLFYFSGVLLMDAFAMIVGCFYGDNAGINLYLSSMVDVSNLNLSLFLAYATLFPDTHFMLFFIIPIKAWIFAVFYLAITAYEVIICSIPDFLFPFNMFPLVALANYFLFFGSDIKNVFPLSWRVNAARLFRKKKKYAPEQPKGKTIPFPTAGSYEASSVTVKAPYTHRCAVCGRTDVSDPELEFRYCSKCNGYHCYCEDHISNHTHIE
jgi:hypothetical protein